MILLFLQIVFRFIHLKLGMRLTSLILYVGISNGLFQTNLSSQVSQTAQKLTLPQIIDSAMISHPLLKNSRLNITMAKVRSEKNIDIKPTEFLFRKGQLYSTFQSTDFEIKQNFGSPASWIEKYKLSKRLVELEEAQTWLKEKEVIYSIKLAYYNSVFQYRKMILLSKQKLALETLKPDSIFRFRPIDSVLLETILAENKFAEMESKADEAYNDWLIANNNLVQAAFLNTETEPSDTDLIMVTIAPPRDTNMRAPANLFLDLFRKQKEVSSENVKIEKLKFFPEVYFGYFVQTINKSSSFTGWQAGLSLPIWYFSQNSNLKEKQIEKQMAENEFEYHQSEIAANTANLITGMNKLFERLNYFYDFGLRQADNIESTANNEYKTHFISLDKYIESINTAYQIRMDYLETINNYNQKALELEVYTY